MGHPLGAVRMGQRSFFASRNKRGTACLCAGFLFCDLCEGRRGAAGAGARCGDAGGGSSDCGGMGRGAEGERGGGCGSKTLERRSGERVVAGIAGAGGRSGNDGLAGGEDCSSEAGHGAVMCAVAAAACRQAGFVVSQCCGQRTEQEDNQEQNGSATPHMELSVQESLCEVGQPRDGEAMVQLSSTYL